MYTQIENSFNPPAGGWENVKHPRKPNVKPVKVTPIFPAIPHFGNLFFIIIDSTFLLFI